MMNNNFGMKNGTVAAISADGRFTHKIHTYTVRKYGLALDLKGLRQVACERLSAITGNRIVIPQSNSRMYLGMNVVNPNPLEQQLNNYALNSGLTLRVNKLTASGKEKDVDSMVVAESIAYGNSISGYSLISGDRDFTTIFQTLTSYGIPCILFTARFNNTNCSHYLKEAATEVIDLFSLLGDRRVFKPVQQTNARIISYQANFGHNAKVHGKPSYINHMTPKAVNGSLTNIVELAIQRVIQKKSFPNKPASFAYQADVLSELENMNMRWKLRIPLSEFLSSKNWKFCTGFYDQRATVSVKN